MADQDSSTMTRREREREQHRQEILEAAEAIFSEKGISGTTIEDIARRADFAVGSIYNFFTGKDDLIHQVFLRLATSRSVEIEAAVLPIQNKPVEALKVLTGLWVSHHAKHGAFLRVAFVSNMASGKAPGCLTQDADVMAQLKRYESAGCTFFKSGSDAGCFQKLNPMHLMLVFEGICRSFLFSWERTHDTRPKEKLAEELFEAIHAAITGRLVEKKTK